MTKRTILLLRVLAILAALCLLGALGVAVFYPPRLALGRLLGQIDHQALVTLQEWVRDNLGEWTWRALVVPLLVRPAWLLPLMLGIILAGLTLTIGLRRRVPGAPRWRN